MAEQYTITPENFSPDMKWFGTILRCEDEYGKMMRTALYVEEEIDNYLELSSILSKKKLKNNTTFYKKVEHLRENKITDKLCDDLITVNQIRNKFAHNKDISFKDFDNEIRKLIQNPSFQFSANDGPLYEWNFINQDTVLKKTTTQKLKDMTLGDQLAVISSMLSVAIYTEH